MHVKIKSIQKKRRRNCELRCRRLKLSKSCFSILGYTSLEYVMTGHLPIAFFQSHNVAMSIITESLVDAKRPIHIKTLDR